MLLGGLRMSITDWLSTLGLHEYADLFERERIDLDTVRFLTDANLKDLELPMGHRAKLLAATAALGAAPVEVPLAQARQTTSEASQASTATGERRQLTVLFCDIVGYTELASRVDPEILQGIIRTYEDTCAAAITRYEGYVYQRLGDGIVAFFGYPLAHEGEAERAIRAGLDIIEALRDLEVPEVERLSVRIGIAAGMVVVTSTEKGAVGETMNLAARLQGIAAVNTVVVSERACLPYSWHQ
jgi:class 3 adenylate cyclase